LTSSDIARSDNMRVSDNNRRRVRIQVMKDFRYKERSRNSTGMSHFYNDTTLDYLLAKKSCKAPGRRLPSVATLLSQVPPTIHDPELWRSSFAQSMAEGWLPKQHSYTASLGKNIAYTYHMHGWAPVVAILDALSLLHVGSTTRDESLLLEARKRYVRAIYNLRTRASQKKPRMPAAGLIIVAMGILMSEVRFHPVVQDRKVFRNTVTPRILSCNLLTRSRRLTWQYPMNRPQSPGSHISWVYLLSCLHISMTSSAHLWKVSCFSK
jgi:hypothetical protein